MTVAIIGGTGFLGNAVAKRLLAHGQEVLVIARGFRKTNSRASELIAAS